MKSDIFNAYVKIAEEQGLVSKDSEDSEKKLRKTHRADSLDIKAIEALYGVKPDSSKEMDYKNNIMEIAHPNNVVVSPSHDKLNGLVENNIERQNIMLNIVRQTPDGLSTQKKYAEKELTLALVRIANELDNKNKDELRVLADTCLMQVNSKIKKQAGAPMVAGIAVGVAAVFGIIWAVSHLSDLSDGLEEDFNTLQKALSKFESGSASFGVGHEYDKELINDANTLKTEITTFMNTYHSLSDVLNGLEHPGNAGDVLKMAQDNPKLQAAIKAINSLNEISDKMKKTMAEIKTNFSSDLYKSRHVKDTGILSKLLERTHIQGGRTSLLADNFENVITAMSPFQDDVQSILDLLSKVPKVAGQVQKSIEQVATPKPAESTTQQALKPTSKPDEKFVDMPNLDFAYEN